MNEDAPGYAVQSNGAPRPITVEAARHIGREFGKSAVIVVGWEPSTGLTHVATWGAHAAERHVAAKAGERVAELLTQSDVRKMYEDFRGSGAALIATERDRQVKIEGWTPGHDDEHVRCELVQAAIAYARDARGQVLEEELQDYDFDEFPREWPWETKRWKPSEDPIRNLVKAGALIAAEIDRLIARELMAAAGAGQVQLTHNGRAAARLPERPSTSAELQALILAALDGPEAKILGALIGLYPEDITRDHLGSGCGYKNPRSGGFSELLGKLIRLGLVEVPHRGRVRAARLLFLEGGR